MMGMMMMMVTMMTVPVFSQLQLNGTCVHQCLPEDNGLLFAEGCCESTFCQCNGGLGVLNSCEEGQIFNEVIQNCDWIWHVPCCNETLINPSTPPSESCQSNLCEEDGYFPEGICEPDFCQCVGGRGHLLHCQEGLFFNQNTQTCDWPWNNQGCSAPTTSWPNTNTTATFTKTTPVYYNTTTTSVYYNETTTSVYYNETTTSVYNNETTLSTTTVMNITAAPPFDNTTISNFTTAVPSTTLEPTCQTDCVTQGNGVFAEGCCEATYCQCFHGEGVLQQCPEGSVFNEEEGFCDEPETVPCCQAGTTLPPTVTTTNSTDGCGLDCTGHIDGSFAEGCCLPHYCVCDGGIGFPHDCINGTVFDEIVGFCHHPQNVECCSTVLLA